MTRRQLLNTVYHNSRRVVPVNNTRGSVTSLWYNNRKRNSSTQAVPEARPFNAIPGPLALPYIGSSYKYFPFGEYSNKDLTDNYIKMHAQYGDIVREQITPSVAMLHLFDVDDVEMMYRMTDKDKPPRRSNLGAQQKYRDLHGLPHGIVNDNSDNYYKQRSPTQRALLRPQAVSCFAPAISKVAEDFVHYLREIRSSDMTIPNVHEKLQRYVLEAATTLLFGEGFGAFSFEAGPKAFVDDFLQKVHALMPAEHALMMEWSKNKSHSKIWEKYEHTMDCIYQTIEDKAKDIEEEITGAGKNQDQELNLLKSLLLESDMQRIHAIDISATLLFAATDTTSNTLMFTTFLLSQNPQVQENMANEIKDVLKEEKSVTNAHLDEMKYLKAVVKETNRVRPVSGVNSRSTRNDMVIKGYLIPADTLVLLHSHIPCQKDKYFSQPEKFLPERWLRGADRDIHPFASLPFGFGVRGCIGRRFAEQEIHLALAKVFQNFRVEYEGAPLKYCTKMITFPDGDLDMRFYDR